MATVTNRVAAPAQRGQGVVITLDSTDAAQLANMTKGNAVTNGSSKTGVISRIDVYGHTFIVIPTLPNGRFDTTASPGICAVAETIQF